MGCLIECRTTVDKAAVGLAFKMRSDSSGCDQFIAVMHLPYCPSQAPMNGHSLSIKIKGRQLHSTLKHFQEKHMMVCPEQ